ncbi:MAG: isoprenyl transferase [Coraliomargaritaceae bacterium]
MLESRSKDSPAHVAIIMDGNGRWANQQGLPRIEGHRKGAEAVRRTIQAAYKAGITHLTLFAFSVENWNRPKEEIDGLMHLLEQFLETNTKEILKAEARLRVIGRYEELPENIQKRLRELEAKTADNTKHTLALAINYGARTEIVDAVSALAEEVSNGRLNPKTIDYSCIRSYLYTDDLPDPDLVIRTSGECRLSNFLLLQSAYAEIHISDVLWPDFSRKHLQAALDDYATRERRYGKTGEQVNLSPI